MPRVWGGDSLRQLYRREFPADLGPVGESWELSDRPEAASRVDGGPWHGRGLHELWQQHRASVFGSRLLDHPATRFPLLLKILDASQPLSLQVHPPAAMAAAHGGEPKDECWYVAHAEPDAIIWAGVKPGVDATRFSAALANGGVTKLVHTLEPCAGQFFNLPSGRLHALGAGLVVFEIQQNSDTTYRVFDWNRVGPDGRPRELHIEQSLRSIDFNDLQPAMVTPGPGAQLSNSDHFRVSLQTDPRSLSQPRQEAVVLALVAGGLQAGDSSGNNSLTMRPGDFVLLPAAAERLPWHSPDPSTRWLEIRIGN